jgi:hypothetical protein
MKSHNLVISSCYIFETILAVIVQETNQYMQHDAWARNKPDVSAN